MNETRGVTHKIAGNVHKSNVSTFEVVLCK